MFEHPYDNMTPPVQRGLGRKLWLLIGGLALAVGVVALITTAVLPALAAPGGAGALVGGQGIGLSGSRAAQSSGAGWAGLGGHGRGLTVTGVSGSPATITATTRGGRTVTIHTTASTTYTRAGQKVSGVAKGDHIAVRGTRNSDGSITASRIAIILPTVGGKITAIASGTIKVTGRRGQTFTINTTASTNYVSISRGTNGPVQTTIARSSLKVGDFIVAEGAQAGTNALNALIVAVVPAGAHAGGHGWWHGAPSRPTTTSTASE